MDTWLILGYSINFFYSWANTWLVSCSTVGQESTNFWLMHMSWKTLGWLLISFWSSVGQILIKYRLRCWLSINQVINQGYQSRVWIDTRPQAHLVHTIQELNTQEPLKLQCVWVVCLVTLCPVCAISLRLSWVVLQYIYILTMWHISDDPHISY